MSAAAYQATQSLCLLSFRIQKRKSLCRSLNAPNAET